MTTATAPTDSRPMPPVLGRLMSGTFWMALRTPLQAVLAFFSIPLIIGAIGPKASSAYAFAWGFGFFQFLFEFGKDSSSRSAIPSISERACAKVTPALNRATTRL